MFRRWESEKHRLRRVLQREMKERLHQSGGSSLAGFESRELDGTVRHTSWPPCSSREVSGLSTPRMRRLTSVLDSS